MILNPNCCGGMEPRLKELSVRTMENPENRRLIGIEERNRNSFRSCDSCCKNTAEAGF